MLDSTPVFEALSIPELLDAIQVYLTLHDIVQCAAVSKPFQALFAPLLWETITIKTRHQHVAFTTVPEVQDALVRNAPHIRIIYLRTCKSLEPFLRVDPAHLKLLHTVAFPWALKTHDRNYYYKDMDEDYQPSFASSVYTLPLSTPQDAGQSRQERRPRSTYSAIDRVFAQQDWLRAEGMFPAREQAVGTQLRHLQRFQELQRRQAEERKRAAQGALAFASATIATPPGTPTASSSSSSNVSASTTTSTATMTTQQRMANMLERQRQLQQVQNIQTNRQRLLQVHLQQQLQQQQAQQQQAQQQQAQQQQAQQQQAQQQQAQQQTQQTPPLQPPLQQQPILSNQQQLQLQQLQNQIQQGMQAQQAHGTLHFQVLQQQSRQNAQHGLQHHSLQLRTPQIILAANQQMAAQAHATAQTAGLIQQLVILENREQASLLFEANRRGLQGPRVNNQQVMQALETQQAALLESQRLVHQQLPWKDYSPHRQVVLRAHEMALINAERQFVYFHGIVHQHKILSPQEHRDAQTQVDQYLPQLVSLQQTQRGIAQSEGQQQQQVEPTLGPANFQEQVNQLTLVRAMERLQLCIEVLPRAQAHLDSIESIPAQPWFVDNAEDERWLVRFMTRFSELKAFGSGNLILSNKEVWDSMGRLWSDIRVLSLVLFKYATGPPPQRHLELAALLDRCPPRLESLQLSFSAQDMFLHPSTHEFTRINNDAGPAGPGSVALEDIPTLRRVYIEGHIGKKDYLQDAETWIQFLCRCPNLQSLALGSCTWQVTRLVAAKVKDYWPQLEEFATSPIRQTAHDPQLDQSIAMLLNAACWGSTSVDNDDDEEMVSTDPVTDTLILRRRGMKKVRFDQLIFNSQSPTLQSLFRLSHSLTHLSMRDCQFSGGSASDTLLRLLRACDRLVEVDLLPSGSYYRSYLLPLNAQQFVKLFSLNTPWPSTRTLKVFRVAIDGCGQTPLAPGATAISIFTSTGSSSVAAPLPSSLLHSSGVVDPSFMSASSSSSLPSSSSVPMQSPLEVLYELQRQVCQILGSFTALEELSLGVHCERDQLCGLLPHLFQQTLCLEMMLESGLNLMGGLKQLRILNVSRMAHQIGVTELEWMQAHWPRLHTVQGLLRVANWSHRQAGAGQHAMNTSVSTAMVTEEKERNEEAEESEKRVLEWAEKNFSWLVFT